MPIPDNIETVPAGPAVVDKIAKEKAAARARAAASRLARKRTLPADQATVFETIALCLFDSITLPPSKRAARSEVVEDVTRQVLRTLTAMGHPDVAASWLSAVEATTERLRKEKWHHPLSHGSFARPPVDTRVTPSAPHPYSTQRIAESTESTERVRTD